VARARSKNVVFSKEPRLRVVKTPPPSFGALLRTLVRVLTLRASGDEIDALGWRHFALGMACAILAGIGRHWDYPPAPPAAKFGLASAAYAVVFATVMWPFIALLGPDRWEWRKCATFVALTSPPAWLYAIPVELWLNPNDAARVNYVFLAAVAIWRLLLLAVYIPRYTGLDWWARFVGWSTPLVVSLGGLFAFGLFDEVANFMAGARQTPRDLAAVLWIGFFAFLFLPLALFLYLLKWLRG
jgi:hypothetical protein